MNNIKKSGLAFYIDVELIVLKGKWVTDAEPLSWGSRVETDTLWESGWSWRRKGKDRRDLVMGREGVGEEELVSVVRKMKTGK